MEMLPDIDIYQRINEQALFKHVTALKPKEGFLGELEVKLSHTLTS